MRPRMSIAQIRISAREGDCRSWDRLQEVLGRLKPGQTVTIRGMAARTGLGVDSVETVLRALTRAALFAQLDRTTFRRQVLPRDAADRSRASRARDP